MSQTDLQFVSGLLQAFLLMVLPVLAVVVVRWVLSVTKTETAKLDKQTLDMLVSLATMAVKAAEQANLGGYIQNKKIYALNFLVTCLQQYGLEVDMSMIEAAIEAAVMEEFNRGKEPVEIERVEQPRPAKIPADGPFQS